MQITCTDFKITISKEDQLRIFILKCTHISMFMQIKFEQVTKLAITVFFSEVLEMNFFPKTSGMS
jgi:hypothetical protein